MSLEQLRRWSIDESNLDRDCCGCTATMIESQEGKYVLRSDVEAMLGEVANGPVAHQIDRMPPLGLAIDPTAFRESYDRAANQLAQLRLIADKAALLAIAALDPEQTTTDDVGVIDLYLRKTEYLDQGEDAELDLVRDVIHPLMGSELAPFMDYVSLAQRDMARKQRIKDELGQVAVLLANLKSRYPLPTELISELEYARTALLFASSDVLDRASLMALSPSVRIAERFAEIKQRTGTDYAATIDWSQVDAEHGEKAAAEVPISQGEGACCQKCGDKLTGHEDDSGTHCRWCVTCGESAGAESIEAAN